MENKTIIVIACTRILPEHTERYFKWVHELYYPSLMKTPWLKGIDSHRIVEERPEYNRTITVYQYGSLNDFENLRNSPEYVSFLEARNTTYFKTGLAERFWFAAYQLERSFTNTPNADKGESRDAHVISLEGYRLSPDEEERYDTWISKRGYEVYIPLLMKLPSLKEYALYKNIYFTIRDMEMPRRQVEYPPYLSILTFENLRAYQNYETSLERAAIQGALRAPFPRGLDFRWYVQYQWFRSWRK